MKQFAGGVLGLAAIVAASVCASAQSDAPVFPVSVWDTGVYLPSFSRVETVDFDRDGRLDVIASIGIHGVWLLRGDGRGGLESRAKLTPGPGFDPFEFRSGDFDGDGWPDVLVHASTAGTLGMWILHGDGSGGTTLGPILPGWSWRMTVTDLDGDGFDDAVYLDGQARALRAFRGSANGMVATSVTSVGEAVVDELLTADVDGDGRLDLVVGWRQPGTYSPSVTVLRGDGAGGFAERWSLAGAHLGFAADLDADGSAELFTSLGTAHATHRLVAGQFQSQSLAVDDGYYPYGAHDVDRDGDLDLWTGSYATWRVKLVHGGAFNGLVSEFFAGGSVGAYVLGDLDGDGWSDFVGAIDELGLFVCLASGQGRFERPIDTDTIRSTDCAASADLDGDGLADLLEIENGVAATLTGNGAGEFTFRSRSSAPLDPASCELVDLDLDGDLDWFGIAWTPQLHYFSALNDGAGVFGAMREFAIAFESSAALRPLLADFDGDGAVDVLVRDLGLRLCRGDGFGGFTAPLLTVVQASGGREMAAADFDRDGRADLVLVNGAGEFECFRGMPDGSFNAALAPVADLQPNNLVAGDFNGDGHSDLAFVAERADRECLGCLLGDGAFGFAPPKYSALANAGEFPWRIAAAHVGGGPGIDLVLEREPTWGSAFSNCTLVECLVSRGDGTFATRRLAAVPRPLRADIDNDGRVDFLGRIDNGLHERLHVFLGK